MNTENIMKEIKRQYLYWKELAENEHDETVFLMYIASKNALFDVMCALFDYDENKASLFLLND